MRGKTMTPQGLTQQSPTHVDRFQNTMINVVYNVCSIFTIPVEMVLRPKYGSRYFPPVIMFFSAVLMTLLPLFLDLANGFSHMIPFVRFRGPVGLYGIGSLSKL